MYKLVKVEVSLENAAFSPENPCLMDECGEIGYSIAAFLETVAIVGESDAWCKKLRDSNGNTVGSMKLVFSKEDTSCSC